MAESKQIRKAVEVEVARKLEQRAKAWLKAAKEQGGASSTTRVVVNELLAVADRLAGKRARKINTRIEEPAPEPVVIEGASLFNADNIHVLRSLPSCSVDALVIDPPSGIAFMAKQWDRDKGGRDGWVGWFAEVMAECHRVMKPGAHALVWALPRTSHWTCLAVEQAEFEIRDILMHVFGTGFPKSLDVSKAMDRQKDNRDQVLTVTRWIREARDAAGLSNTDIDDGFGFRGMAGHWTSKSSQPAVPTIEQVPRLLEILGQEPPDEVARLIWDINGEKGKPGPNWYKREVTGKHSSQMFERWTANATGGTYKHVEKERRDAPATDEARQWAGWGTALKPSHEMWILARKPLTGTIAQCVTTHGTGALNIDGCRVGTDGGRTVHTSWGGSDGWSGNNRTGQVTEHGGRWPPHLLLTHAADCGETCAEGCPVAEMDAQSGVSSSAAGTVRYSQKRDGVGAKPISHAKDNRRREIEAEGYGDTGGASRFFPIFRYSAKPSTRERNAGCDAIEPRQMDPTQAPDAPGANNPRNRGGKVSSNHHPTLKSIDLMRWLVRLITPPNGVVLDCFMGSGTTGIAATLEGARFIGIEREPDYFEIACARIEHHMKENT